MASSSIACMLQLLEQNGEREMLQQLYSDWSKLLRQEEININMDLRNKFDTWFLKCYKSCEDEGKQLQVENLYMLKQKNDQDLFDDLKEQLTRAIDEETEFPDKLKLDYELGELKSTEAEDWVRRAHLCVKEELKLMDSYNKERTDTLYVSSKKPCEIKFEDVSKKIKQIQEKLDVLERLVGKYLQNQQVHDDKVNVMQGTTQFMQGMQELTGTDGNANGLQNKTHRQAAEIKKLADDLDKQFQTVMRTVQDICTKYNTVLSGLNELAESLYLEIQQWQHQLKLDYVELKATVNLDGFAHWCAKTGEILHEILSVELPRQQHAIQSMSGRRDCSQAVRCCEELRKNFEILLHCFFQKTFVVTSQESWCVKKKDKDKTQIPKTTLRILGADSLDVLGKVSIHAYFLPEDNISEHWFSQRDNRVCLDVEKVKGQPLRNDIEQFLKIKKEQRYEGKFCNILLAFERGNRQKLIHEEKYRLLFYTEVDRNVFWTLSLPMVVTTGANQNCQCLASVMWQCFSTDVFAVPIETKSELPWSTVACMLNTKMEKLSSRRLTDENLQHLKNRIPDLIKSEDDDPMISLSQFCADKLDKEPVKPGDDDKCSFSFWKWFLAIYNLIEKYLLDYWQKGWIEGFISKSVAEMKLKNAHRCRSAMYLLRFSDGHITDSQGLKSVFGTVTAAVLTMKKLEDHSIAKKVHHLDVAGHNKLKDKPLANMLLGTEDEKRTKFYLYLYPNLTPSEQLFSQYTRSDPVVPGYSGVRDAFIVDLEQGLQKLEITGKRMSSSSSGSEDQDGSPDMKPPSLTGLKKVKRDSTETRFSCQQLTSTPPSYSSSGDSTLSPMPMNTSTNCASSPVAQTMLMNTSTNCPVLRTLLTKPQKQETMSVIPSQVAHSNMAVSQALTPDSGNQASSQTSALPSFLSDMSDEQAQSSQQSPLSTQMISGSTTPMSFQGAVDFDSNEELIQALQQQQQSSFMGMLQTDNLSDQNQLQFTQNPIDPGTLSQYGVDLATGNQPVSMTDTVGNQQANCGGNTQMFLDESEHNDPTVNQLQQNLSEEYIINFVVQHIIPKLPQIEKEKLLAALQDSPSPQTEMGETEDSITPEDMVTSSSSGQLPFNQIMDGMESDSGQLERNIGVFDRFEDEQEF